MKVLDLLVSKYETPTKQIAMWEIFTKKVVY